MRRQIPLLLLRVEVNPKASQLLEWAGGGFRATHEETHPETTRHSISDQITSEKDGLSFTGGFYGKGWWLAIKDT